MKVFGTDMELVTFIFLTSEVLLVLFQWLFCYQTPNDTKKRNYLALLLFFVFYNIFGGLFPDPNISISILFQNILAYASGFAVGCYIPYFFYKTYKLNKLKFHVFYGVSVFLILPFFVFIVIEYLIMRNLGSAVRHAMYIPAIYAISFMYLVYIEIKKTFCRENIEKNEMIVTYISLLPLVALPIMAYFGVEQLVEVSVMNSGFVITSCLFFWREINDNRVRTGQLQKLLEQQHLSLEERFALNCDRFKLTTREIEVANLILDGLKYKEIANDLYIAERTVTKHSQNIFVKVGVDNKFDLIRTLKS